MSTLLPSASARPLVTTGTALIPPVPVLVGAPAPSRLIHASSVNVDEPSTGAMPNVTYALVPPKSIAAFVAAALTVMVTVSVPLRAPSLAVSISTYVPAAENVAVVFSSCGCVIVTVPGPLTLLHSVLTSTPGRTKYDGDIFGRWHVCADA